MKGNGQGMTQATQATNSERPIMMMNTDKLRERLQTLRPWIRVPTGIMMEETWCRITPEVAEQLIDHHMERKNRNLSGSHVSKLMGEMAEGKFVYTADAILFDRSGQVIDGQHRIYACFRSGVALECVRVRIGMPDDAIKTIDLERKARRGNQALSIAYDIEISNALYAALMAESHPLFDSSSAYGQSKRVQNEVAAAYPFIQQLQAVERAGRAGLGLPTGALAAAARCLRVDAEAAVKFFSAALSNSHQIDGVTVEVLRLLSNALINARGTHSSTSQRETVERSLKAWNAWRSGVPLKVLKATGNIPEPV